MIFFLLLFVVYKIPPSYNKLYQFIYTFLEFSFFSFFLFSNINTPLFKKIIKIVFVCFFIFQVAYYLTQKQSALDTIPVGVETILILIFISFFFYEFFNNSKNIYIYSSYCFWISTGILFYLGSSFFFNLLANHIDNTFWYITYIIELIKNILFGIGIFILASNKSIQKTKKDAIPFLDMI